MRIVVLSRGQIGRKRPLTLPCSAGCNTAACLHLRDRAPIPMWRDERIERTNAGGRHRCPFRSMESGPSWARRESAKVLYWGDANTQGSPPPTVRVGTRLNSVRAYGRGATAFAPAALGQ